MLDISFTNNSPANITPGKPAFIKIDTDKGHLFISTVNPEITPGMRWMVPRMIRWAAGISLKKYKKNIVLPKQYQMTSLFDDSFLKEEAKLKEKLIQGNNHEKVSAMNHLLKMASISAHYWIPGLLFDGDKHIRLSSAEAIVTLELTQAIPKLETIIKYETNKKIPLNHQGTYYFKNK